MKNIFLLFLLLLSVTLFSQVADDFENGNLNGWAENVTGHWAASTDTPINGVYSLKHNLSSVAGISYVTTPFSGITIGNGETVWQFNFKNGAWNPSGSNYFGVYLFADNSDLTSSLNGYVVGVNMSGTDDILSLWKVTNGVFSVLIQTPYVWPTSATIGIKVTRTASGGWELFYDETGGFDNLLSGGTATDNTHINAFYTGPFFEYTLTRAGGFWFDDFSIVGPPDTEAPQVTSINAVSNNTILVEFNEGLLQTTAENISNYSVDGGIDSPTGAVLSTTDNKQVELTFSGTFVDNNEYTLTVNNVEDLNGNATTNSIGAFIYYQIAAINIFPVSATELDVTFNKVVDVASAETLLNYSVNNGIGSPASAFVDGTNGKLVHLSFTTSFQVDLAYTLTVNSVQDTYGNIINPTNLSFSFHETLPYDIVINEIMCDVNPAPAALPALEYLELYNHTPYDIDLSGWTIEIEGYTVKSFPDSIIPAGSYAIICRPGFESDFSPYGMPVGITSFDLTTSGKRIVIRDNNNTVIEDITYSKEWYDDDEKDGGGYSIERIDPFNFCGEDDNWTATKDVWGGTPGRQNSVFGDNPDNIAPELVNVQVLSSNYLLLEFDDNISYESGGDTLNFSINNGIENPTIAFVDGEDRTRVHLFFNTQFTSEIENTLLVEGIKDNCGNTIQATGFNFTYFLIYPVDLWTQDENKLKIKFSETVGLPDGTNVLNYFADKGVGSPEFITRDNVDTSVVYMFFTNAFPQGEDITLNISGVKDINGNTMVTANMMFSYYTPQKDDIAINEVLFYPNTGGNDFVELYNRSEKRIDLINIQIATYDKDITDSIISISPLSETNLYFEPGTYLAFTESKEGVSSFYMSQDQENIIEIPDIPTLPSDFGTVLVLYKNDTIIDRFDYNEDMHFSLLDSEKGVSLERVNYDKPTQDISNWHSASEYVGFATPAYKNSQYSEDVNPGENPVTAEPYIFSPDNDGFEDYANINYKFESPGYVATVIIFDANGRQVRQLANNLLLSTEGTIVWDGLYDNGRLAPSGTYLIYFKVFNLDGNIRAYKIPVVSTRRL
ncbi:MAG: lamin tail domain-containing protein [Bacteroidales bacterium]|nr:lamin tail domain-containing protein [Bacteroidales bacterium]